MGLGSKARETWPQGREPGIVGAAGRGAGPLKPRLRARPSREGPVRKPPPRTELTAEHAAQGKNDSAVRPQNVR